MIVPYKEENGNVVMSVEQFGQLTNRIKDESYAQGYEDGCHDTYMQCVANISNAAINKNSKNEKTSLRG